MQRMNEKLSRNKAVTREQEIEQWLDLDKDEPAIETLSGAFNVPDTDSVILHTITERYYNPRKPKKDNGTIQLPAMPACTVANVL